MKIDDIINEDRKVTKGKSVIIKMLKSFENKLKNDKRASLKDKLRSAVQNLHNYYNKGQSLEGKLKLNDGSSDRYHYHIGYPSYMRSPNGDYNTSSWFILYKLVYDETKDIYIVFLYDYDDHSREGSW